MSENKTSYIQTFTPVDTDSDTTDSEVSLSLDQRSGNAYDSYDDCYDAATNDVAVSGVSGDFTANYNTVYKAVQKCNELYCDEGGTYYVEILVTTNPLDLQYKLVASNGKLGEMYRDEGNVNETYDIEFESSIEFDFNVVDGAEIVIGWVDDLYLADGSVIPITKQPVPVYDSVSRKITWGRDDLVGTLSVKTKSYTDVWPLTIEPTVVEDADTDEDSVTYDCTVRAFYSGGVESLSVSQPVYESCGGSVHLEIKDSEDQNVCNKIIKTINGCTGEVIKTTIVPMPCADIS